MAKERFLFLVFLPFWIFHLISFMGYLQTFLNLW